MGYVSRVAELERRKDFVHYGFDIGYREIDGFIAYNTE